MQLVIKFDSSKLVEITVFRLERIFQPLRELKSITGHMVYNPAYLKDDRDHCDILSSLNTVISTN